MANRGAKRQGGYSAAEFSASLLLVMAAVFGMDWAGEAADQSALNAQRHDQAVAIAHGQTSVMMSTAMEELEPGKGFVPASWVQQPGYALGQMPIEVSSNAELEGESPVVYDVAYRATNSDPSGRMRKIEVRVSFEKADGEVAHFTIESMRAG